MEFFRLNTKDEGFAKIISRSSLKKDFKTIINKCSVCEGISARNISNLFVDIKGVKEPDIYSVSPYTVINQKTHDVLIKNNITGYTTRNIELHEWTDKNGQIIEGNTNHLKELLVTGRAGKLRKLDGGYVLHCHECGRHLPKGHFEVKGLMVDTEEWDGSDIFSFENWFGNVIITERLKEILEHSKIKNIQFENIKEFSFIK